MRRDDVDNLILGLDLSGLVAGMVLLRHKHSVHFMCTGVELQGLQWKNLLFDDTSLIVINNMFNILGNVNIQPVTQMSLNGGKDFYQPIRTIYSINYYDLVNHMLKCVLERNAVTIDDAPLQCNFSDRELMTVKGDLISYCRLIGADGVNSWLRRNIPKNSCTDQSITASDWIKQLSSEDTYIVESRSYLHNVSGQHIDLILPKGEVITKPKKVVCEYEDTFLIGCAANFYDPIVGECTAMDIYSAGAVAKCIIQGGDYSKIVRWIPGDIAHRYRLRHMFPYITRVTGRLLLCI